MAGQIFVAKDTQYVVLGEAQIVAAKGVTTARAGHPVVAKYPELWEPLVPDFEVEDKPAAKEPSGAEEPSGSESQPSGAEPPAVNAPKAEWVEYAVSQGIGEDEAAAMTKADLISLAGKQGKGAGA